MSELKALSLDGMNIHIESSYPGWHLLAVAPFVENIEDLAPEDPWLPPLGLSALLEEPQFFLPTHHSKSSPKEREAKYSGLSASLF